MISECGNMYLNNLRDSGSFLLGVEIIFFMVSNLSKARWPWQHQTFGWFENAFCFCKGWSLTGLLFSLRGSYAWVSIEVSSVYWNLSPLGVYEPQFLFHPNNTGNPSLLSSSSFYQLLPAWPFGISLKDQSAECVFLFSSFFFLDPLSSGA